MLTFISNNYRKIIKLNYLWALLAVLYNFYLYPKLPSIIPNYFQFDGTPSNPGGRMIIWVLPCIFIVFSMLFNEHTLSKIPSRLNPKVAKSIAFVLQILFWIVILSGYFGFTSFIR
ncbi:hypothetical protein BAU15_08145 [Enterococcus sp. JM4C]|uniref:DUF1648 domain-containing protein n=1 Tax=Candidatus Enterococcus huntleyi TaxID=1857217 RepID=UPI00137AA27F|nr:DUF1648 domain-containing protein [Enterococcus sp. JM4C]KAF1297866.1 hypothetical protein BAU15_08145 [Enterococcus sp. JM4C]